MSRVQEMFDLSDRVAVLTGVGSGIGKATALMLASAGATIVGGDIDEPAAQATADEIKADGGTAVVPSTRFVFDPSLSSSTAMSRPVTIER